MNRCALTFTVRPGTESDVARILSWYPRPAAGGPPGRAPLVRRVSVLLSGSRVVRVMEVNGDPTEVLVELARQPRIRALEAALDPYLEQPRDLSHPDGVRDFLERARLDRVHDRATPAQLLPAGGRQSAQRVVLSCPVRPGCGLDAARLLARIRDLTPETPTTLARTTIFARGDVVVWVVDVAGEPEEGLDGLAAVAVGSGCAREVSRYVDAAHDITSRTGFRRFLTTRTMRILTDRRVVMPAPMPA
jgi:hypothetical protein